MRPKGLLLASSVLLVGLQAAAAEAARNDFDDTSLVQQGFSFFKRGKRSKREANTTRPVAKGVLARLRSPFDKLAKFGGKGKGKKGVDCEKFPTLCTAPFNCDKDELSAQEVANLNSRLATGEGHTNLRAWCSYQPRPESFLNACFVKSDVKAAAQRIREERKEARMEEIDASYCFMEGLCADYNVNGNSTVADGERRCDAKYGNEAWTSAGHGDRKEGLWWATGKRSKSSGISDPAVSQIYGKMACAMGHFHCDAVFCRKTYCRDRKYVFKYGRYLITGGYLKGLGDINESKVPI